MSGIVIKARNTGFYVEDTTGAHLAPEALLTSLWNTGGRFELAPDGADWVLSPSRPTVRVTAEISGALPDDALPGQTQDITAERIRFARLEDGEWLEIGTLDFEPPMSLSATADRLNMETSPSWETDLGAQLQNTLSHEGLVFRGRAGDDIFAPSQTPDLLTEGARIFGRGGDDILNGLKGDDFLSGGKGNDRLYDPAGQNKLLGGAGNDLIEVGDGSRHSILRGGAGDDRLISGKGADRLFGGSGDDVLKGGNGRDVLKGGAGEDRLFGGQGHDTLIGGGGNDRMRGGLGNDTFKFDAHQSGRDVIVDFQHGQDVIEISGLINGYDALEFSKTNQGTKITWEGGEGRIILKGIDPDDLSEDDFSL